MASKKVVSKKVSKSGVRKNHIKKPDVLGTQPVGVTGDGFHHSDGVHISGTVIEHLNPPTIK